MYFILFFETNKTDSIAKNKLQGLLTIGGLAGNNNRTKTKTQRKQDKQRSL